MHISNYCPEGELVLHRNRRNDLHSMRIDLRKAFNRVNNDFLIEKMSYTRVPKMIIRITSQMLTSTYVRVLFGKSLTSEFKGGNGTRQCGMLPLLLYNFYSNNVIESTYIKMFNWVPTRLL